MHRIDNTRLALVLLLLHLEHVLVEVLLQGFVRIIDTELFVGIHSKCLEAKNVEDANVRRGIFPSPRRSLGQFTVEALVDDLDDVLKVRPVEARDQRLGRLVRLLDVQLLGDVPLPQEQHTGGQRRGELVEGDSQEVGHRKGGVVLVEDAGLAVVGLGEGQVASMQDGNDEAQDVADHGGVKAHDRLRAARAAKEGESDVDRPSHGTVTARDIRALNATRSTHASKGSQALKPPTNITHSQQRRWTKNRRTSDRYKQN